MSKMGEASQYSMTCPVCGGPAYLTTRMDLNDEIQTGYICHSCNKIFDTL